VTVAASESTTPEAVLYAVMREESAFEPTALSKASAVGLLQLLPITARKMAAPLKLASNDAALRDPAINVRLGARYLASMRRYFTDDPLLAIPGYNAGRGAPDAWTRDEPSRDFDLFVEAIPYAETRAYTKRVLSSLCAYEILYGDPDASEALHAPLSVRPGL
jgi:soluble lytic murein transglycosylase